MSTPPRRFAPLSPNTSPRNEYPTLKGIVFDVDGTLCLPQTYMFQEMRDSCSIPADKDILAEICTRSPEEQELAMEKIRHIERTAMAQQEAQPGLELLMEYLTSRGIPKGICTRNFEAPVTHLLNKFLPQQVIGPIVTREFRPPKPDPAGILNIARSWRLLKGSNSDEPDATGLIMVGDSIDDMTAGYRAGAATVLLVSNVNAHLKEHPHTDLHITKLDQLIEILENGFKGRVKG